MIKVAITDDHKMVLQGVQSMLDSNKEIDIVATYKNGQETLDNIAIDKPDILLLDINLPDIHGIDLSKQLLSENEHLKIIALTSFEEISFVKQMLKNGVHGYLLKNTDKVEILKAFKTVLQGDIYLENSIKQKMLKTKSEPKRGNGLFIKLTRREQDVLEAISEELTTRQISEKLFISPKTVESHRMNIMSKLGAKNSVGIIKIAMEKDLL